MISSSLIKATVSSLPCAGVCPTCGSAQGYVYESGTVGLCDGCIDVLLGVAELPGRVTARYRDDSDEIDTAVEDDEAINLSEDEGDDHDHDDHNAHPVTASPPSHASLQSIDLHTTDGFEICEHCGAAMHLSAEEVYKQGRHGSHLYSATKYNCSAGHTVCLNCVAAHDGCPLCIEAEGGDEDLSYLDC